jgi:acyl-CoA synthetase (AMP-forming)/AMP-acid ligase II
LNLTELLEQAASKWGERDFLLLEEGAVSYRDFLARVTGLAASLAAYGIAARDRVAVILPNGPEILYAWFALARLGAVMVPLHPGLAAVEIEPLLRRAGVKGLIGTPDHLRTLGERLDFALQVAVGGPRGEEAEHSVHGSRSWTALLKPAAAGPRHPVAAHAVATLLYTSGTTGAPKLAALTHTSYLLPAQEFGRWMRMTPADRCLGCLPLFHLAGEAFAVSAVAAGAALAVVERFHGHEFWHQVGRHRITLVRHLGEMLAVLCKQPVDLSERGHRLRAVYGGGARPQVALEFERRFGAQVVEGYGLTETNTVLRNELGETRLGSIGRPLGYGEVRIADPSGKPLPSGEVGEIQVRRNPVLMVGYWGRPQLTRSSFVRGWFRTRDLGYREDGYFYFVGRESELIRRRGENVVPRVVEEVLDRHPAIRQSAVVGYPDEVGGEEVKAYVIWRAGDAVAPAELVAFCRASLADFEIPRYFEFCSALPGTHTNKIDKQHLRRAGTLGGRCYDRRENRWWEPVRDEAERLRASC